MASYRGAALRKFGKTYTWCSRFCMTSILLMASVVTNANPANCDDDMTEDQRWQAKLCSAHMGCRFVFGIADSCVKAKSFLSKLRLGGKGSATTVTDDQVSNALTESGVPASSISSCLFNFDRDQCAEYFSGGPKSPSAKQQADEIVERLNGKVYSTTAWDAGLGLAKVGLGMCDEATNETAMRDAVRAKERCALAEKNISACLSTKNSHEELRQKLQGLIDSGKLGTDVSAYRNLATTPYPECPTTLPSSGKTPNAALAEYLKWWDTPEDKQSKQTDAADAAGTTTLPRRGNSSGAALFQDAINDAELSPADLQAKQARQAELDKKMRAADSGPDVLGILGNAALAAAGGTDTTEMKKLALGSLAQSVGEPGSATSIVAKTAIAAAGGKDATEKQKLALEALTQAADKPSVSGKSTANSTQPMTADTSYVVKDGACNAEGFNQAIKEFTERYPQNSSWGMRDTYQYSYFLGNEGLKILQGYKPCLSNADFDANYKALVGARDNGLQGCRQLSSDGGDSCQPQYPG